VEDQEQARKRDQVNDQREHAVERVSQGDHGYRPPERTDRPGEEGDFFHRAPSY
jgi:hypothetical protein